MAKVIEALSTDVWMTAICNALQIDPGIVTHIQISATPGEALIVELDCIATPEVLKVQLPQIEEMLVSVYEVEVSK